jgi:hypothetical protein
VTNFDPEDEDAAGSFFHIYKGVSEVPPLWVPNLHNVSQTGLFCASYIVADKIAGMQSYSFCHSRTFPRQARLLALFFLGAFLQSMFYLTSEKV